MSTIRMRTEGARKLQELLTERGQKLLAFCEENDLDYAWVYRQLSGERGQRVSVDFAEAIEKATAGAIPMRDWHSRTRRPIDDHVRRKRSAKAKARATKKAA